MHLRYARSIAITLAVAALLIGVGGASANVPLLVISQDPFTNATSQHATEVEPDTFAAGTTIVSAFQVGRFFNGGASDIGVATSTNNGVSWTSSFLPGLTFNGNQGTGSPYERVSDPSVAYDAKHNVWLVSSIPLLPNTSVPTVFVSRSTDGGLTWGNPVSIPPPVSNSVDLDKNWTVCDNHALSPFFGHCYTELDNFGDGDLELMSTSTDGGVTWSVPIRTDGNDKGLGGQPLVQPSGKVIVPFESLNGTISAFSSDNGGASWKRAVTIAHIRFHRNTGGLRTSPLPSAEIAGDGRVFVAWEDCRFRKNCPANDIVFSTSTDGVNWGSVTRVPIDDVNSGVDHFIPGLAVDPTTQGSSTRVALTYYFYPDTTCTGGCELDVGYTSSPDGGAHWGLPTQLAGPMTLDQIAQTSQGPMVGDYISTSFNSVGRAVPVFAVGAAPSTAAFNEAMYTPTGGLAVASSAQATRVATSSDVATGPGIGATIQALRQD